ncbi:MAG: hypothetical protein J7L15_01375 [Clostridiales bacterium]|nr:hypothetical protein [Clostridiales bacterium]
MSTNLTQNGNPKLFTRTEIKASLMQFGYGQQEKGTKKQLATDLGSKYDDGLYDIFLQAVNNIIPGFSEIMETINGMWRYEWLEVSWTMPDGVVVTCKPTSQQWVDFKLFGKYPIKGKVSGVGHEEKALILYVTIIHSCDAYIARELIRLAKEQGYDLITIHDGFRQLPNQAFKTKANYNKVLASINDSNLLTDILSQIAGFTIEPIQGDLNSEDILQNKYSLS